MAVVYNLARFFQDVHMVGTQGKHGHVGVYIGALYRVQNAGRIVHHAVRIDGDAKLIFDKPPPHAVSKA